MVPILAACAEIFLRSITNSLYVTVKMLAAAVALHSVQSGQQKTWFPFLASSIVYFIPRQHSSDLY